MYRILYVSGIANDIPSVMCRICASDNVLEDAEVVVVVGCEYSRCCTSL